MNRLLALLAACAALALGACGGDGEEDAPGGGDEGQPAAAEQAETGGGEPANGGDRPDKPSEPKPEPKGIEITTGDSQFGEVLFDADDRAIYLFDKETTDESECYGECAVAWPPVLTKGEPQASGAVAGKLLGTTERDDGSLQVTYDGRPLYYYVDEPPGQVLCHNVDEFGGLWLVIEPSGAPVA
jgi:predicted lipoprotein with Yx(FWY)xxD motif